MSATSKGDSGDAGREDGVVSSTDAGVDQATVTVVNCSVNHSGSDAKDAELGAKSQAASTTVRYRSERRRWSSLERYLVVVCVVLLLTTAALAVIVVAFSFFQTGRRTPTSSSVRVCAEFTYFPRVFLPAALRAAQSAGI